MRRTYSSTNNEDSSAFIGLRHAVLAGMADPSRESLRPSFEAFDPWDARRVIAACGDDDCVVILSRT